MPPTACPSGALHDWSFFAGLRSEARIALTDDTQGSKCRAHVECVNLRCQVTERLSEIMPTNIRLRSDN